MFGRQPKKPPAPQGRVRPSTPASSGKVFSYYASRQPSDTPLRERSRGLETISLKGLPAIPVHKKLQLLLIAGLIFVLIFVNLFVNTAAIPKIVLRGTPQERLLLKDKKVYEAAAQEAIQDSFMSRTKLTINTKHIETRLLKKFPELGEASMSLPLAGSTPTITLVPAHATFLFTASDGSSYVITDAGKIIAPSGIGSTTLLPVTDQSGLKVTLSSQALPTNDIAFLKTLHTQLLRSNIQPSSMTLPRSSREVDVHLQGKSYIVKFSLEGDAYQQAGAYIAVQQRLDAQKITPAQYIDARVGDRVFYK